MININNVYNVYEDEEVQTSVCKCLLLCDVLRAADVLHTSPYIAYKYGEKFNTAWKDNHDLIKKYYRTHRRELCAYNAYLLTRIIEDLVDKLKLVNFVPTIQLDAASINSINNILKELENDADNVEIQQVLTANLDDVMSNTATYIRRPIFSKFELLNQIACANVEIDRDIQMYTGSNRNGAYIFCEKLSNICVKVLRNIKASANCIPVFHAWGTVLSAIYKLHIGNDWLYSNGYSYPWGRAPTQIPNGLLPYCYMALEDVLVEPDETVYITPDERLFKMMGCDKCAGKPGHDLVSRYVNTFYALHKPATLNSVECGR